MISERKLKKYRRLALIVKAGHTEYCVKMLTDATLELTQELLDQNLIKHLEEKEKDFISKQTELGAVNKTLLYPQNKGENSEGKT